MSSPRAPFVLICLLVSGSAFAEITLPAYFVLERKPQTPEQVALCYELATSSSKTYIECEWSRYRHTFQSCAKNFDVQVDPELIKKFEASQQGVADFLDDLVFDILEPYCYCQGSEAQMKAKRREIGAQIKGIYAKLVKEPPIGDDGKRAMPAYLSDGILTVGLWVKKTPDEEVEVESRKPIIDLLENTPPASAEGRAGAQAYAKIKAAHKPTAAADRDRLAAKLLTVYELYCPAKDTCIKVNSSNSAKVRKYLDKFRRRR